MSVNGGRDRVDAVARHMAFLRHRRRRALSSQAPAGIGVAVAIRAPSDDGQKHGALLRGRPAAVTDCRQTSPGPQTRPHLGRLTSAPILAGFFVHFLANSVVGRSGRAARFPLAAALGRQK